MSKNRVTNDPWGPTKVVDTPQRIRASGVVSKEDIRAINNCWNGKANPHEQKTALMAIIYGIARAADMTYHRGANSATDSAFSEGMRHAGRETLKFAELGNEYLADKPKPE